MPNQEMVIGKLGASGYFTKIDLSKEYWQIPIKKEHIVQCLRGVLCAWRVREVSLQIIHKGPLGKHNNQGGRLVPWQ